MPRRSRRSASDRDFPPEWELFDLASDPYEPTSVHDDPAYATVREDRTAELGRQQREIGDRPRHHHDAPE